jgi:hypothetical protein
MDTRIIPWQIGALPTSERIAARFAASRWLAEMGCPLDGHIILGLETILICGIVPE